MEPTLLSVQLDLKASIFPKNNYFGFNVHVYDTAILHECNFEFEDDLFDIINRFIDDLNDGRSFEELDKKLFKDRLLEAIQRIQ